MPPFCTELKIVAPTNAIMHPINICLFHNTKQQDFPCREVVSHHKRMCTNLCHCSQQCGGYSHVDNFGCNILQWISIQWCFLCPSASSSFFLPTWNWSVTPGNHANMAKILAPLTLLLTGANACTPYIVNSVWWEKDEARFAIALGGPHSNLSLICPCLLALLKVAINTICIQQQTLSFPSEVALCPLLPWSCDKLYWNIWFRDYQYVFYLEKVIFHLGKVYFNLLLLSNSMSNLSHFWMASHVPQEMSHKWSLFRIDVWDFLVPFLYHT